MKESVDVYTAFLKILFPRLVRLYRENPMEDESLVTAFIHSVLEKYHLYADSGESSSKQ